MNDFHLMTSHHVALSMTSSLFEFVFLNAQEIQALCRQEPDLSSTVEPSPKHEKAIKSILACTRLAQYFAIKPSKCSLQLLCFHAYTKASMVPLYQHS